MQGRGEWKIITKRPEWGRVNAFFRARGLDDVYFHHDYARLHAGPEDMPVLFLHECGEDKFMLPLIRRPLPDYLGMPGRYDLETPYGYGGPVSTSQDESFIDSAWEGFFSWARKTGVVAGFLRLHPLLDNHCLAGRGMRTRKLRETVFVNLSAAPGELWSAFKGSHRRAVRKAERSGLEILVKKNCPEAMKTFMSLYWERMEELKADDSYFFPEKYFMDLVEIDEDIYIFLAKKDGEVAGGYVFISSSKFVHYHLGASPRRYSPLRVNNFLMHHAIMHFAGRGHEALHLGGGTTNDPADPLLRFKGGFSPLRARFHIATFVTDENACLEARNRWQELYPDAAEKYSGFHLCYRYRK